AALARAFRPRWRSSAARARSAVGSPGSDAQICSSSWATFSRSPSASSYSTRLRRATLSRSSLRGSTYHQPMPKPIARHTSATRTKVMTNSSGSPAAFRARELRRRAHCGDRQRRRIDLGLDLGVVAQHPIAAELLGHHLLGADVEVGL